MSNQAKSHNTILDQPCGPYKIYEPVNFNTYFFGLNQNLRMLPNTADVKKDAWRDGGGNRKKRP